MAPTAQVTPPKMPLKQQTQGPKSRINRRACAEERLPGSPSPYNAFSHVKTGEIERIFGIQSPKTMVKMAVSTTRGIIMKEDRKGFRGSDTKTDRWRNEVQSDGTRSAPPVGYLRRRSATFGNPRGLVRHLGIVTRGATCDVNSSATGS